MKKMHDIVFMTKTGLGTAFKDLGVKVKENPINSAVQVDESHKRWSDIQRLIEQHGLDDRFWVTFSPKELGQFSWLVVGGCKPCGYPMPDDDFGYMEKVYDLSEYDSRTGIGAKQVECFRIKEEPKWGSSHFLGIHWEFDVLFTKPDIWESIFQPMGISMRPVLNHSTGKELQTIVQLIPEGVLGSKFNMNGFEYEGRGESKKYHPIADGYFPPLISPKICHGNFLVSNENFGSGGSSNRALIVSSKFYALCKEHKLRGIRFVPILEQGQEI